MAGMDNSIRLLLRPTDAIKFILECYLLYTPDSTKDADESGSTATTLASRHKRIVAVVTHKDEIDGWEEGR